MRKPLQNIGASVRPCLLNLAKERNQPFDLLLTRYSTMAPRPPAADWDKAHPPRVPVAEAGDAPDAAAPAADGAEPAGFRPGDWPRPGAPRGYVPGPSPAPGDGRAGLRQPNSRPPRPVRAGRTAASVRRPTGCSARSTAGPSPRYSAPAGQSRWRPTVRAA